DAGGAGHHARAGREPAVGAPRPGRGAERLCPARRCDRPRRDRVADARRARGGAGHRGTGLTLDAHPGAGRLFVPRAGVWRPDRHTWVEPDLFLVTAERLRATDAGHFTTADVVVEALSAGSATYDRTAKRTRTLPSGCASCGPSTSSGGRSGGASSRRAPGGSRACTAGPLRWRRWTTPRCAAS